MTSASDSEIGSKLLDNNNPWNIPEKYPMEFRIMWKFKIGLYDGAICFAICIVESPEFRANFLILMNATNGTVAITPAPIATHPRFSMTSSLSSSANIFVSQTLDESQWIWI